MVEEFEAGARRMIASSPAAGAETGFAVAQAILATAFPCR